MSEIPDGGDSGSKGTQQSGGNALVLEQADPPLGKGGLTETFVTLAASGPKAFGSGHMPVVVAAFLQKQSEDIERLNAEVKTQGGQVIELTRQLAESEARNAVLCVQLGTADSMKKIASVMTLLGSAAFGVAIDLFKGEFKTTSVLIALLGAALFVVALYLNFSNGVRRAQGS